MVTSMQVHLLRAKYVPNLVIPVVYPKPDALLHVKNITGLEPVTAKVNTHGFGEQDGEFYIGSNVGKRNIVVTLGLSTFKGSASVSEARKLLYGYCMPKHAVKLLFYTDDHGPVAIEGHVESLTPNRFSQDPEIQVSFICHKPNFTSLDIKQVSGSAHSSPSETEINYFGTIPTGLILNLSMAKGSYLGRVMLEHRMLGSGPIYRVLELESVDYLKDDYLLANTNHGERSLYRHSDEKWNLLSKMTENSTWTFLASGTNLFRVRTPDGNVYRDWTLSFVEQYGGI